MSRLWFNGATAFIAQTYDAANRREGFTVVRFYTAMTLEAPLPEKCAITCITFYDFRVGLTTRRHDETSRTFIFTAMTRPIVFIPYVARLAVIPETRSGF